MLVEKDDDVEDEVCRPDVDDDYKNMSRKSTLVW